ncbi:MAG: GNAT family N-acetyltransferase [Pseudobdellovibrionaceae bacterium]
MTNQIRIAHEKDLGCLEQISRQCGEHTGFDTFQEHFALQVKGERELLILSDETGRDVTMAVLNWKPQYAPFRRLNIPEIQDIKTIPEARRNGYGEALISWCEARAKVKGLDMMGLAVGVDASFGPAQKLYIKMGYEPDGGGLTYEREPVHAQTLVRVDENLCLMLVKYL